MTDFAGAAEGHRFSGTENRVFMYLCDHIDSALALGVRGVAAANGTSASTVMRVAKKAGYAGFTDMCYQLRRQLDFSRGETSDPLVLTSVLPESNRDALTTAARRLRRQRGVIRVGGHGFSNILARYLGTKLPRMGLNATIISPNDSVCDFENSLEHADTYVAFSRSGTTERIVQYARIAQDAGACVISFTGDCDNELRRLSGISLVVPDASPLDVRNAEPTFFYAETMMLVESLLKEYAGLAR